jgi:chorismate mutase
MVPAICGATTVESNTAEDIEATDEMLRRSRAERSYFRRFP